jgi:uncharacterized phage protein (TIGR02218 family)
MADYTTLEKSVQDSRPLEVYDFSLGAESFRYTSRGSPIVLGAATYEVETISRSAIEQGRDTKSSTVTIKVPSSNVFARKYVAIVPGRKATLSIIRLQRDEAPTFATQVLGFKGRVQAVNFADDGRVAEIAVRSLEDAGNRNIPRFKFTGVCNHLLYDNGCKVSPTGFSHVGACTSGGATTEIEVAGVDSQPDGYWTGGYVTPTTGDADFRMVLAHAGTTLTLMLPFSFDVTGINVQVFAGCDHLYTGDCATKFDNVIEFGGFPFVPNKNIYATGLD